MLEILGGVILGLGAGLFGVWTLYQVVRLLRGADTKAGNLFTIMSFLAKFPLIGGLGYVAWRLGEPALISFTAAIVVVYFALVWRATRTDLYRD